MMRIFDYFRLGAKGVRSRRRSTANTVVGIVFGLMLLIPVLFFTIAFRADLNKKVNASHAMASVQLPFSAETKSKADIGNFALGDSFLDTIIKSGKVSDLVRYELFAFSKDTRGGFSILHEGETFGGSSLAALPLKGGVMPDLSRAVKAVDPRDGLVTEGTLSDMGASSVLIAGEGFTTGRGEVILSEPLVRALGYRDPADILGKTIGLFASSYINANGYFLDNDSDPDNEYLPRPDTVFTADVMQDFRVCGVISEAYYLLNSMTYQEPHIWISLNAVYREDGSSYLPALRRDGDSVIATYPGTPSELADAAAAEGMFFPAIPAVRFSRCAAKSTFSTCHIAPVTTAFLECTSFDAAADLVSLFEREARADLGESAILLSLKTGADTGMVLVGFLNLRMLNTVAGYIITVMLIFGGVVLLATLLNLFNSVNYSVQMRKNYMGMLQAVGAKKSVIPKLYFVEILLLFLIALPFALLLAGGISYGMKMGVDAFFSSSAGQTAAELFTASISLNMGWLAAAVAITLLFTVLISLLFALIACRSITRKGITDVLSEEQ